MHADAARRLFDTAPSLPALRLAVALAACVGSAASRTPALPAAIAAGFVGLVIAEGVFARARRVLAVALPMAALLGGAGALVAGDRNLGLLLGARLAAGAAVASWTSSTLSWPALVRTARALRVPEGLVERADRTVAQGLLLQSEVERRWAAATLRGGFQKGAPRVETWGRIVAGGVGAAFERAVRLEEAWVLRGAPRKPSTGPGAPALTFLAAKPRHADGSAPVGPIDLSLAPGEWVALLGPSGSGKSTLLAAAAGLLEVVEGELLRFGAPVSGKSLSARVDRRVALVCQDPADQILGSTPLEDVLWGLHRAGAAGENADRTAMRSLEDLGIGALAERPVARLSFGERKRVACAAALAVDPFLLLLDEPTTGLDARASRALAVAVESAAAARGSAVVWATHDVAALPKRVERALLLVEGRPFFDGPLSRALSPETLRKAGLVPDSPGATESTRPRTQATEVA